MKKITLTFGLLLIGGISGCIGWGDYMKFSPGPTAREIWFKESVSEMKKDEDRHECDKSIEKSLPPVVPGDYSYADKTRHIVEYCMLAKGYTFKDVVLPGRVSYCSKTYYGSGPACKSIGR